MPKHLSRRRRRAAEKWTGAAGWLKPLWKPPAVARHRCDPQSWQEMKRGLRGTLDRGRLLIWTAALTAIWVGCVVLRRGYASDGIPFAWRWSHSCVTNPPQWGYLLLDVSLWFALTYTGVRGFTLMQRSPFRRPFRWRPLPPDRE